MDLLIELMIVVLIGLRSKVAPTTDKCNYTSIQLGCIEDNKSAYSFWLNKEFKEIRRVVTKENGRKDWNVIVMENIISKK